ncbi:DMT family transporter [Rhodobacteraceae bacterium NNCM2]|nr:DMT family transporter [Coraliihabitans acroporae]
MPSRAIPISGSLGAVGLVLIAMTAFSFQDIAVKMVVGEVSLWQLMFVRSTATLGLMVVIVAIMGKGTSLIPKRWGWPLIRAGIMCGAYLLFYASLSELTVTIAAATFFTGPLFITLLAALILSEPIGPRRIAAVVIGFVGVIVIIRPGTEDLKIAAFLPLGAALCYALGNIITRWRCREEANFALSLVHNLLYANIGMLGVLILPIIQPSAESVANFPFLLSDWKTASGLAVALMLLTAGTHLLGILCIVTAYQNEDASRIAPFEYTYLVIIPVLEFAIWGLVPDQWTMIGMSLIMLAGVFVAWREGRPVRPRVQTTGNDPWTAGDGDGT